MAVRTAISVFGLACLLLASGCNGSPEASVSGTVLVGGELASSGVVTLYPVGGGATASGRIHRDGSYVVKVGQGNRDNPDASTIPPGEYVVTVVVLRDARPNEDSESGPPRPGDRWSAPIYADRESTPLRVTVSSGRQLLPLELDAAPDAVSADDGSDPPSSAADTPGDQPDRDETLPEETVSEEDAT
ncbi:hypothetical protein Pla123a_31890 [Posidoniimonas polymericola]|uniref:Carboxypeptidase regulatory-like domain-containing protein n=1 Tax=Posidoniimonas polymericola TaxID=2528002 RepID=A0A5C5YLJ7_9BACT|nr:hypothetical protein [Posidoniimonas polymericola]TWT75679.1 hypothetical protein Pla123a_31890 [Posidoniimonas polymericola]